MWLMLLYDHADILAKRTSASKKEVEFFRRGLALDCSRIDPH
jgi:hypothetical protein